MSNRNFPDTKREEKTSSCCTHYLSLPGEYIKAGGSNLIKVYSNPDLQGGC